jgi:alanine-alpha-ketoisovalerate/valine-pyruvate aminotransferase
MEGIDTEALKKQLDVLGVAINGPKQWMLDWIDIPIGAERNFNGLKAVWCAVLSLKTFNPKEHIPYSHHHNCP